MEGLRMKNKTLRCPYLTAEDKKFLKYELKVYEENVKEIIELYEKYKNRRKSGCKDTYLQHSSLGVAFEANMFNVCSNIQNIFISDVCRYFCKTYCIKELDMFVPQCEIADKTKILTLDYVYDKYIRQYLE